jgi:hypothetical protein
VFTFYLSLCVCLYFGICDVDVISSVIRDIGKCLPGFDFKFKNDYNQHQRAEVRLQRVVVVAYGDSQDCKICICVYALK